MDFLKVTKNHLEYREPNFEEEEKKFAKPQEQ